MAFDLINSVKGNESVDVLLHSPGGRPDATERIVGILRGRFKEVNFSYPSFGLFRSNDV